MANKDEIAWTFHGFLARYGYRRTSLDEVCRALRISKKSLYVQFASKEELYAYAMTLWAADQRARVETRITTGTAVDRLREVIAIAFADAREGFAAWPDGDISDPPDLLQEVNERVFGPLIRDLIVAGVAEGAFRVADPDMSARFCVALGLEGMRLLRLDPRSDPAPAVADAVLRLVGAPPPGAPATPSGGAS